MTRIRLTAISGSLQASSSNLTLLHAAAALVPADVEMTIYDGIRDIPAFDPDIEAAGLPLVVSDFIERLRTSDGLIIASPEYAHGMPGSLKNAIDWLVGSYNLDGKPVAVTTSVNHPARGQMGLAALTHVLEVIGATIIGGEPTVRGEGEHDALVALVGALVDAARASSALTGST